MATTSQLLEIPREVRDQILFYVFFDATSAAAFEAVTINNRRRQVVPTYPKEQGYDALPQHLRSGHAPAQGFDVSVLRACRQLQNEGEELLYSNIKFDLWSYRYNYDARRAILEHMGAANRARLRHLRISELSLTDVFDAQMPLCEWTYLTKYIAINCPSLQTLELRVKADVPFDETRPWSTTTISGPWVQALLNIKGLEDVTFSLEGSQAVKDLSFIAAAPPLVNEVDLCDKLKDTTSWLKMKMTEEQDRNGPENPTSLDTPFSFTELPEHVQKRIIRYVVLPPNGVIHPTLPIHITENSENILPMLLSSHAISSLVEEVLYEEPLFSCCDSRFKQRFMQFIRGRSPRQQQLMRNSFCPDLDLRADRNFITFRRVKFPNLVDWTEKGGFRWWVNRHPCFYTAYEP